MNIVNVLGLGFGDEGKGSIVDFLCKTTERPTIIVRASGGSQCSHAVDLKLNPGLVNPPEHCVFGSEDDRTFRYSFRQFGSGTFRGAKTLFTENMLLDPVSLAHERHHLKNIWKSINSYEEYYKPVLDVWAFVGCTLITRFHVSFNTHINNNSHSTCGCGIGITRQLQLEGIRVTLNDLAAVHKQPDGYSRLLEKLTLIKERLVYMAVNMKDKDDYSSGLGGRVNSFLAEMDKLHPRDVLHVMVQCLHGIEPLSYNHLCTLTRDDGDLENHLIIFEGNQGVLLDQWYGPGDSEHRTFTDCTFRSQLAAANYHFPSATGRYNLGVLRTSQTRHGNGFMYKDAEFAPEVTAKQEFTNGYTTWQGPFRRARFSTQAVLDALRICGSVVSGIALNHVDEVSAEQPEISTHLQDYYQQYTEPQGSMTKDQALVVQTYQELLPKGQRIAVAGLGASADKKVILDPALAELL